MIDITAEESADALTIAFSNEGPTIPAEKLAQLFDKFFRVDESRSTQTGGAGLGLAIAKDIAATAHGGSLTAKSETVAPPSGASASHAAPKCIRKSLGSQMPQGIFCCCLPLKVNGIQHLMELVANHVKGDGMCDVVALTLAKVFDDKCILCNRRFRAIIAHGAEHVTVFVFGGGKGCLFPR